MPAPLAPIDAEHPQPRAIQRAAAVLELGELISYPTDSCYALGCDARARRAVERLYALKGRDHRKPFALLVPDLSDVARYAIVSNFAYRVLRQHTPGAFTFVLPATRLVPELSSTSRSRWASGSRRRRSPPSWPGPSPVRW